MHYCVGLFYIRLFSGLTWFLVYRTEKYKKLKSEVDKQSKKRKNKVSRYFLLLVKCLQIRIAFFFCHAVEKRKEVLGEAAFSKNRKRRLDLEEERLKSNNRDLSSVRMKSMFAIGFCFTALLGTLNSM